MEIPLRISFRNMDRTPEVEEAVREKVDKLEEFFDRIVGCHVVVEAPHRHHHKGNIYEVRVFITVPRRELVVNREPGFDHAHEDVRVAIRDAFDKGRRQLEDYVREMRGATKHHEIPSHGHISKLFDDFGFIETPDGEEVYFHANSLVGHDFEILEVGHEVRFVEEPGDEGPQATSIHLLGRHHHIVD
jgi:cold shock CspA family protein/ribosome-associated translation inhibitor RaiA